MLDSRIIALFKYMVLCFGFLCISSLSADRYQRPMQIHKVKRLGLEIWTEIKPEWNTEVIENGKKPIFVAHTPHFSYPPSGMSWVNHAEVIISGGEFADVAKSTLRTAAKNYQMNLSDIEKLNITSATYGILKGYEVNFIGKLNKKQVDVRVFTGRSDNKGPITIQVYSPVGKIKHLSEQIRRSWTNTRYLN